MQPVRGKLFIGQHFIYSLRVIEHYLRTIAKDPLKTEAITKASVDTEMATRDTRILAEQKTRRASDDAGEARDGGEDGGAGDGAGDDSTYQPWNIYDQQMLDLLLAPLRGYSGVDAGAVAPRASVVFSSVVLSRIMRENSATLNNYLQIFKKKRTYYYESSLLRCPTLKAANTYTDERMSGTPYRVRDTHITPNLAGLVRFVIKDNGFFDGLNLFYYLFYRWHRIDYSHIRAIEEAGVTLPYRDELLDVLRLLEERRLGFDAQEVVTLIDEYFEYYARFISDAQVVNALDYSYHTCCKYDSPAETERMLRDLWAVHRAFYRMGKDAPPKADSLPKSKGMKAHRCLSATRSVWIHEEPRIPDRIPYASGPTWEGSFANAFAAAVERKVRTDAILADLAALAGKSTTFTLEDCRELKLLLESANMTPRDFKRFASNIHHYDAVKDDTAKEGRFVSFEGLNFSPPYYPLIDSGADAMLGYDNFTFEADPTHLVPSLEVGPFKPLLDDLFTDSRLKAMGAGYQGISEFKIYLHDCKRDAETATAPSPHYTFKAGKCDYFTGVARKDLFSRFLVPSIGNLRQPLLYLLESGTLPEFVFHSSAQTAQRRYRERAGEGDLPNVRLSRLFADDPELESKLMELLRNKIDELYARLIRTGHTLDEKGALHILDNGATYTGCGTFVLTGDRDAEGRDRPLLLLEKRWRVSEENDNLSYPSGGSCDLYVPDDRVPQEEYEYLKELEASPFVTAARELREELNLICRPDDLQLVSFGIDVNRNLQQFSFVLESAQSARRILERKSFAATPREGFTFFLPFERQAVCSVLNNYQMESGAVYSLMRLMELKAHRLWSSSR